MKENMLLCCWVIFMKVSTLMKIYFCAWTYFSWWCALMKFSHEMYTISPVSYWNTHEISNSHAIHFMMVTLTKYQTLTRSFHDSEFSRNSAKYCHENTDANLVAKLFSWGWPSQTPTTKRICGGELSWKWEFRVSIIVRVDTWRCTLTHYFRESKTIFRDMFCILTKSPVSSGHSFGTLATYANMCNIPDLLLQHPYETLTTYLW
jgi:hypothetical protein